MSLLSILASGQPPADRQPTAAFRLGTPRSQPLARPHNPYALMMDSPIVVQGKTELCVGCKVQITGGPHRDHNTAVIVEEAGTRHWMVVSTSTKFVQNFVPFRVEKADVAPTS